MIQYLIQLYKQITNLQDRMPIQLSFQSLLNLIILLQHMNCISNKFYSHNQPYNHSQPFQTLKFDLAKETLIKTISLREKINDRCIDIEIDATATSKTNQNQTVIKKELNQVGSYLAIGEEASVLSGQQFPAVQMYPSSEQQQNSTQSFDGNGIIFNSQRVCNQPVKRNRIDQIDYLKNVPAYIVKKALKIILCKEYRKNIQKQCARWGVHMEHFISYYEQLFPNIYGPNSIIHLFKPIQNDISMKKMFANVLRKVLRKKYLLLVLREGRMEDLKCYIEYKNKYVMYFDSLLKL